ncbi:MAG: DUF1614 domain-containing protein [Candidatus Paceibacterota bacterium]
MDKDEKGPLVFVKKPEGVSKFLLLLTAIVIIEGAHVYLLKYLGEDNTLIFAGIVLVSLPLSLVNIRIARIKKEIIYANLGGFIIPLLVACYFLTIVLPKLSFLVAAGSVIIGSAVQINRTKVSDLGGGGIALFIVIAAVGLSLIVPFNLEATDSLLYYRLYFVYMIAVLSTINSDLFFIYKYRNDQRMKMLLIGGWGIFDGIWLGGYLAVLAVLDLHRYFPM